MKAIEFTTASHDGVINIPQNYKEWFSQIVRVILLSNADGKSRNRILIPRNSEAFLISSMPT